jgi:hypothetical protein
MSKKGDLVKAIAKKAAPKSSYGTDPNDPWSARAGINENITSRRAAALGKYLKAKGWNPKYINKDQKDAHAKTGDYLKWKRDHGIYEDTVDEDTMDPKAAVAAPGVVEKNERLAKIVKSSAKKLKEGLYDWEKDSKPKQGFKQPKLSKTGTDTTPSDADKVTGDARAVLKGGTTMTGQKRDTVEIDPMLKNRGKFPDYVDTTKQKSQ